MIFEGYSVHKKCKCIRCVLFPGETIEHFRQALFWMYQSCQNKCHWYMALCGLVRLPFCFFVSLGPFCNKRKTVLSFLRWDFWQILQLKIYIYNKRSTHIKYAITFHITKQRTKDQSGKFIIYSLFNSFSFLQCVHSFTVPPTTFLTPKAQNIFFTRPTVSILL